jgi:hypothetical protein
MVGTLERLNYFAEMAASFGRVGLLSGVIEKHMLLVVVGSDPSLPAVGK